MLKRGPSLTIRAAAIFASIYVAMFAGMLILMSRVALGTGATLHAGSSMALSYAANDLERRGNLVLLSSTGRFADLAARNPNLWLVGSVEGSPVSFGSIPPGVAALVNDRRGELVFGRLNLRGVAAPVSVASIKLIETSVGPALIAAGGVEPSSLRFVDTYRFFMGQGLLPLLVLGAVGLAAIFLALPVLTAALRRVTADAAGIRPERPDTRLNEAGVPRELMPLVRGFNAALDRLAGELSRRKQFIADVAHELKTPLAIASLQLEALRDKEEKKGLQRVITRMSQLVSRLLDVERLSLSSQPFSKVDLSALTAEVIADLDPMCTSCGYELALEAPAEPVFVLGDPHALSRAVANLIGNAVAHGNGEGLVKVVVMPGATVDVIDEGPGVPAAVRDTLFEPFSRGRWDRDGCGLGLHLTREIMRAHGGDALLLPRDGGAAFRLDIPQAAGDDLRGGQGGK